LKSCNNLRPDWSIVYVRGSTFFIHSAGVHRHFAGLIYTFGIYSKTICTETTFHLHFTLSILMQTNIKNNSPWTGEIYGSEGLDSVFQSHR